MSMKKTDLDKRMAKQLEGKRRSASIPQRFGAASTVAAPSGDKSPKAAADKLVAVSCRLPAALVAQMRERAVGLDGGIHALVAAAVAQWLEASARKPAAVVTP